VFDAGEGKSEKYLYHKEICKVEAIDYFANTIGKKMDPECSLKEKKRLMGKSVDDDHEASMFLLLSEEGKGLFIQDILKQD
jgi:hypothetical protein